MQDFLVTPWIPDIPPLPRRFSLSWSTSVWGLTNRHGSNALNTVQLQRRELQDAWGGFRLARSSTFEAP